MEALERLGWVAKRWYEIDGTAFSVRSTDESFLDLADRYLEAFRADETVEERAFPFSADCGSRRPLAGRVRARPVSTLYLGLMKIYRGTSVAELAGRMIFSMRQEATGVLDEQVLVRAAALAAADGSAVLIPSLPQPNLPTLAALLMRSGMGYISDEITRINPVTRLASGSPLPLLIDSAMLPPEEGVRTMRTGIGDPLSRRRPVLPSELGGSVSTPLPVGRILFPVWEPGAETQIVDLPAADAVFRFAEAALNLHVWEARGLTLMRELLDAAEVSALVVGALDDAAQLILEEVA
jgi:hypothetical protein